MSWSYIYSYSYQNHISGLIYGEQIKQQLVRSCQTCMLCQRILFLGAVELGGSSPEGTGLPQWTGTLYPHCNT